MSDTLTYEQYTDKSLIVRGSEERYGSVLKTLGARRHTKVKVGPPGWLLSKDKEEQLKKLIEGVSIQEVSIQETKNIVSKRMGKTKIETIPENTTNLEDIEKNIKSRKGQKKYHRAVSNKESDDETEIMVKNIDTKIKPVETVVETTKIEETTRPTRKPSKTKDSKTKDTKSSQKPLKDSIEEKELLQRKKEEVERFEKEKREHERRKDSSRNAEVEKRRVKERRRKETPDKRHKEIYISSSDSVSSSSSSGSPSSDSSSDGFPEPRSPKRNKDKDYDDLLKKVNTLQKKLMKMDIKTHRRD